MNRQQQHVVFGISANQHGPQQRADSEVERLGGLVPHEVGQFGLRDVVGKRFEIDSPRAMVSR